jgi:hypothetical protein
MKIRRSLPLDEKYLVTISVHRSDRRLFENELDADDRDAHRRFDIDRSRVSGPSGSIVLGRRSEAYKTILSSLVLSSRHEHWRGAHLLCR